MAYLSEPEAGGRTIFPQLGLTVKPEVLSQTNKIVIFTIVYFQATFNGIFMGTSPTCQKSC